MTIQEALQYAITKLTPFFNNADDARREAEWLLAHLTKQSTAALRTNNGLITITEQEWLTQALNERIINHKPLAYILGWVPFCSLEITIEPPILIPRHETEEWVDELITIIPINIPLRILDLCTGSGCIALAIAKHRPNVSVIGVDILPQAVALAQKNRNALGTLPNLTFRQTDLYNGLNDQFDMIISNPPYLAATEWNSLDAGIRQWESPLALISDDKDGADLYRRIIQEAWQHLKPRTTNTKSLPALVLEHGYLQAPLLSTLLTNQGFTSQIHKNDLFGKPRVIYAWAEE
jgi:release factor glutamine methyltransferase